MTNNDTRTRQQLEQDLVNLDNESKELRSLLGQVCIEMNTVQERLKQMG